MRVKNTKQSQDVWCGQTIQSNGEYDLQTTEIQVWRGDSKVIQDLSSGDLLIGDGTAYKSNASDAVAFLLGTLPAQVTVNEQPPFAAKKIGALKLFTRVHGVAHTIVQGLNTLDFNIPYNNVKFNGLEIVGAVSGDYCDLEILDTPTGTISTVPNYKLNQFGFSVYPGPDTYKRESQYDADLIKDMKIRVKYTAQNAGTIYVNYILHELKP